MNSATATFSRLDPYVSSVEKFAAAALHGCSSDNGDSVLPELLNGHAGAKLRETVPLRVRREHGAFFSGSALRAAALSPWLLAQGAAHQVPILDPAIGAGDLLIEVAQNLPVNQNLAPTLSRWGEFLHGRDVEQTFVRLAKARLVLLAVSRGAIRHGEMNVNVNDYFPEIKVGDGLDLLDSGWSGGHIVMNPPYTYRQTPGDIDWAGGRTNLAAFFLAAALQRTSPGTRLTAILPDVIRTGSRYERLRSLVERRLRSSVIEQYGRFDAWTDIDVFILRGVIANSNQNALPIQWWRGNDGERLGDRFDVSVGPVVPHRDREFEHRGPYLHARAIPLGGDYNVIEAERRGFRSRLFVPPFVVLRRTSRPGDKSRGVGTVILGDEGVLVENHLIVLKPKDDSVDACRRVVNLLKSSKSKQFLDDRIRCRHLTVKALNEVPWGES